MTRPLRPAWALAAAALSCTTPATQITVTLDTDAPPALPVVVRVQVAREQGAPGGQPTVWRFRTAPGDPRFPASFAVVPEAGHTDGAAWIYLDATFGAGAQQFVIRRVASARFVAHETVAVSVFLNAACGAAADGCVSVAADRCTAAVRCEERGLTCGDDGRCAGGPALDGGAPLDAPAAPDASPDARPDAAADVRADSPLDAPADARLDASPAPDVTRADASLDLPPDVPACPAGLTRCAGQCVDTASNSSHCGACGRACAATQVCAAGACRCVPSCAGRACGGDGCGGSCGACAAPFACNAAGACACPAGAAACGGACCGAAEACISGRCCPSAWRRDLPRVVVLGTAREADGSYLVAGREGAPEAYVAGDRGFIATLDACGAVTAQAAVVPPGQNRANYVAVATRGPSRLASSPPAVVGFSDAAGNFDGIFTRLTTRPIAGAGSVDVRASPTDDLFWQAAQSPDGTFWLAGSSGAAGCTAVALVGAAATAPCVVSVFPDCPAGGSATGVTVGYNGRVWVTGAHGASAFFAQYPAAGCATAPGCSCAPAPPPVEYGFPGASTTTGRSAAAGASSMYIGGYAYTSGVDAVAYVAQVTSDGRVSFSSALDRTPLGDGFLAVAYSAVGTPTVYAAGLYGWNGVTNTSFATGLLAAYDPVTLALRWSTPVPGAGACWSVNVDDTGAPVVTCSSPTSSSVRRCQPTGACP